MPTDAAAIARKTKLSKAERPVVLDGGPGGFSDALTRAIDGPVADKLTGKHDWIAYPKGSSKRQTDLTRDQGWDALKDVDLMWLSLISIDDDWSAFSLRKYKPGEARQTFR